MLAWLSVGREGEEGLQDEERERERESSDESSLAVVRGRCVVRKEGRREGGRCVYVLGEILFLPRLSVRFGAGSGQVIRDKAQWDEDS